MAQNVVKALRVVTARHGRAGRDFIGDHRLPLARLTPFRGAVSASIAQAVDATITASQQQQEQQQQQPHLSDKSQAAIKKAAGNDPAKALLWGCVFLHAGIKNGVDPNLLVGLAAKESSLNPEASNGGAQGLFQITPGREADLKLSDHDLFNPNAVVNAVAASLASATKAFNGNADLAIASWTVGVAGTKAAFSANGMQGVRNLLLDSEHSSYGRVGSQYIDVINSFQ